MQNKGAIRFFAIALALACIYQLSFTFVTKHVEKNARSFGNGDLVKEAKYLDSIATEPVYNFLWLKKYTYRDCQSQEINLGLDLKGGMNVTLEVSVVDVIRSLTNYSSDSTFNKALKLAKKMQENSQEDFIALFGKAFTQTDPNAKLAALFISKDLNINFNTSNEDVLKIIRKEADGAIDNSFNILRNRIDRFGVAQPNIQKLETTGRILIELPGVKDPDRVRKLLQGTANLEFWETYENEEVYPLLEKANVIIAELESAGKKDVKDTIGKPSLLAELTADTTKKADTAITANKDTSKSLLDEMKGDSSKKDTALSAQQFQKQNPLFAVLYPSVDNERKLAKGAVVGLTQYKDTAIVNRYLALKQVKSIFPPNLRFLWTYKPIKQSNVFQLIAIRSTSRDNRAPLDGGAITSARVEFGNTKSNAEVSMSMNPEGSRIWARLTADNVGKQIAIVLDNYVYSFPVVNQEIKGGNSSISGDFTIEEAQDLANVLKSGKLPAPAQIIEEAIVGPSLGQESIQSGLISFIIAFILVLIYMQLYYNKAGLVANIALLSNIFFLIGVLASLGAVLTLPGIAGIVLTMGMAVDANVIIFERIREELRAGKGIKLAVRDGYKNAYSAIIDGNVTTIITGIVLYMFGSGPVQGFATTLIIGILTSLFSAIFISRLVFEWALNKNWKITFDNKYTRNFLTNTHINFIGLRKKMYVFSLIVIGAGIVSMVTKGFSWSVDFTGGRTYVVRVDQNVKVNDVRASLQKQFGEAPEVKTFGAENQIRITTKYLIKENNIKIDSLIETKLYDGLKSFYKNSITPYQFSMSDKTNGIMSSQKVGPTIADDIKIAAIIAVIISLIAVFIYVGIRFRSWQWGLGGVTSLFHDTLVVLSFYSIFAGILPFNMDIDQAFIAAILTVIGYSINDTVIIFDRIREYRTIHPRWEMKDSINSAINSTLGRTLNTSLTTIVVLIAIFIFGGEVLRGFIFALLIGVTIGTYSSVFNATPVAYDFFMMKKKKKEGK
ncbi:MAG: protein translocase subunit SecDF [Bacteroidetes bacterium CG02_land_8_20_14_3_00_31_25]|nr:protein translocase subunit SecDF [Bacteroidota bacterium]PIV61162.1 MAG: protein translocase subunit SecDF [Bacteroidetes bacterium CG02_land_8_20_14_3_00_31_25]PIY03238.1 MAG: protein translocase subunit SecDF [Bacteroidetes bacterium CG_4_10_14_3_um_filter_31_20]